MSAGKSASAKSWEPRGRRLTLGRKAHWRGVAERIRAAARWAAAGMLSAEKIPESVLVAARRAAAGKLPESILTAVKGIQPELPSVAAWYSEDTPA